MVPGMMCDERIFSAQIEELSKGLEVSIADISGFYIALSSMIIGVQLFLAGFIAELISRNSHDRNNYQVEKET